MKFYECYSHNKEDIFVEHSKQSVLTLFGLVAFGVLGYWSLENFKLVQGMLGTLFGLFFPFVLGAAIAFILNVPMRALERGLFSCWKGKNGKPSKGARWLSLLLAMVGMCAVVIIVLFLVIPELLRTFHTIGEGIPALLGRMYTWALQLEEEFPGLSQWILSQQVDWQSFDWESFVQSAVEFLKVGAGNFLTSTVTVATSVVGGVFKGIMGLIFAIYILLQKEQLAVQFKKLLYAFLPEKFADETVRILSMAERTFSNFMTGQCLEAVILGSLFFLVMTLLRLPYALMISVLIAFTALIPVFGAFIGCFIGAFLIFVASPMKAVEFVVLFCILQQLENNLIYPRVVGTSVGLPAMWVMMAVAVGGSLLGVVGMLVSVPLASILYTLLREKVYYNLRIRRVSAGKWKPGR